MAPVLGCFALSLSPAIQFLKVLYPNPFTSPTPASSIFLQVLVPTGIPMRESNRNPDETHDLLKTTENELHGNSE